MSRVCEITGKKPSRGNKRSHACNATKRIFGINIVKKKVFNPKTGKRVKMKISMAGLRTLSKNPR
jgi:large subunit ribosomal protein L28